MDNFTTPEMYAQCQKQKSGYIQHTIKYLWYKLKTTDLTEYLRRHTRLFFHQNEKEKNKTVRGEY